MRSNSDYREVHQGLDVLDTPLCKNLEGRGYLDRPIEQMLTELSILAAYCDELEMQPWYYSVYSDLNDRKDLGNLWKQVTAPCKGWKGIFELYPRKVVTNPNLEEPSDGKFDYPSNKSGSPHKTVNTLCKTEINLDNLWSMIDSNIWKFSQNKGFATLGDCLMREGSRDVPHRGTREHTETPRTADPEYPVSPSSMFHDRNRDIAGNFDRLSIIDNVKPKTC